MKILPILLVSLLLSCGGGGEKKAKDPSESNPSESVDLINLSGHYVFVNHSCNNIDFFGGSTATRINEGSNDAGQTVATYRIIDDDDESIGFAYHNIPLNIYGRCLSNPLISRFDIDLCEVGCLGSFSDNLLTEICDDGFSDSTCQAQWRRDS